MSFSLIGRVGDDMIDRLKLGQHVETIAVIDRDVVLRVIGF
jgi:hypothetical protein